jgi:predicted amidohydrolase YtcJ
VTGFLKMPVSRYVSPGDRLSWRFDGYEKRTGSLDGRVVFLARFTKALADAGIPLVAGTDAPAIPGLVSGFALHDDLQALSGAGLTPYQVLVAATRTPGRMIAEHVPGALPFGVVAVGNRADLVLVRVNPLDGLATLREPLGVMANGRWYDASALGRLREQVVADYARVEWGGGEGKKSLRDFP